MSIHVVLGIIQKETNNATIDKAQCILPSSHASQSSYILAETTL